MNLDLRCHFVFIALSLYVYKYKLVQEPLTTTYCFGTHDALLAPVVLYRHASCRANSCDQCSLQPGSLYRAIFLVYVYMSYCSISPYTACPRSSFAAAPARMRFCRSSFAPQNSACCLLDSASLVGARGPATDTKFCSWPSVSFA